MNIEYRVEIHLSEEKSGLMGLYQSKIQPASISAGQATPSIKPGERLAIERKLLQMYPRLQRHDLFPWNLVNGPLIPDFLVRNTGPYLRRIVIFGCADGVLCNIISLLFPSIEVVGIDPSLENIAKARLTVGKRQNIKFICGNAAIMNEIPCDRVIYNHCLSRLKNTYAYRKLLVKTLNWLVAEGDFVVIESPLRLGSSFSLLHQFWTKLKTGKSLTACMRSLLAEAGYPNPLVYNYQKLPGLTSEVFYRFSKGLTLSSMLLPPEGLAQTSGFMPGFEQTVATPVSEWQDLGDQSTHSVLGFLFSNSSSDFSHELG